MFSLDGKKVKGVVRDLSGTVRLAATAVRDWEQMYERGRATLVIHCDNCLCEKITLHLQVHLQQ